MRGSWTKSLTATQRAKVYEGHITAHIMIIGHIVRVREQGSDADLAGVALAEAAAQDLGGDILGRAAAGLRDGLPLLVLAQPELRNEQGKSAHCLKVVEQHSFAGPHTASESGCGISSSEATSEGSAQPQWEGEGAHVTHLEDQRAAIVGRRQQQVVQLDVAVGDAQAVAVVHRHSKLLEQAPALQLRHWPPLCAALIGSLGAQVFQRSDNQKRQCRRCTDRSALASCELAKVVTIVTDPVWLLPKWRGEAHQHGMQSAAWRAAHRRAQGVLDQLAQVAARRVLHDYRQVRARREHLLQSGTATPVQHWAAEMQAFDHVCQLGSKR